MGLGTTLNIGPKAITQVTKKAYVKPTCDYWSIKSLGLKIEKTPLSQNCANISEKNKDWQSLVNDLDSYIKPENFLGGGYEARVYKLNEKYVLRIRGKRIDKQSFKPLIDIFEGRNFGQPVAISDNGLVTINKFVDGNIMYKNNDTNPNVYLKKLEQYASLPDETLKQFVDDVAFINKKGFGIDDGNQENFLYNPVTQRIGIVDINKKGASLCDRYFPYGHEKILNVLCNDGYYIECAMHMTPKQKTQMLELISKIEKRVIPLCKQYNIPISKYISKDYMQNSIIELLHSIDKINPNAKEGIGHQLVTLNHPNLIPNLAYEDIRY